MGSRKGHIRGYVEMEDGSRLEVANRNPASRKIERRGGGLNLAREKRIATTQKRERAEARSITRMLREVRGALAVAAID